MARLKTSNVVHLSFFIIPPFLVYKGMGNFIRKPSELRRKNKINSYAGKMTPLVIKVEIEG